MTMALEVLRNSQGGIDACCEWWPFNDQGVVDENGKTIGIANFAISKGVKVSKVVKIFTQWIMAKNPQADRGYFFRRIKRPGSAPKIFSRPCWKKLSEGK